jgi:hypothetical protein
MPSLVRANRLAPGDLIEVPSGVGDATVHRIAAVSAVVPGVVRLTTCIATTEGDCGCGNGSKDSFAVPINTTYRRLPR